VDSWMHQAAQERSAAEDEIRDLRAEVDRLHRYIRRQWTAVAAAESAGRGPDNEVSPDGLISPEAQARAVLVQAQEIAEHRMAQADARLTEAQRQASDRLAHADRQARLTLVEADREAARRIAESDGVACRRLATVDGIAEQVLTEARQDAEARRVRAQVDSNRLLLLARTRYQDLVTRAHQRADRAAELALDEYQQPRIQQSGSATQDTGRTRVELELKAAYLRTFAKVSRAALQAALDVTAREFDRLLGATVLHEALSPATASAAAEAVAGPAETTSDAAARGETGGAASGSAELDSQGSPSAPPLIGAPRTEWRLIVLPETELATVTRLR
jgi:hypothetical protein